jgi:hypothetical protein
MTTSTTRSALALLVALSASPVLADHEGPDAHAKGTTQTIVLDGADIRPASTKLAHGDIVSFVNYSTSPIMVTFTDKDLEQRVRCGLVHGKDAKPTAPWALFTWQDGKLAANVPPGQFASVCSFAPGTYAFTTEAIGHQARNPATGVLPSKGTIEVQ